MSSPPFVSMTQPPRVQFTDRFVQPPSRLYVSPDEKLYIVSTCNIALTRINIRVRMLRPDGTVARFDYYHETNLDARIPKLEAFNLMEGYILSATVFAEPWYIRLGECYINFGLLRGTIETGNLLDTLGAGYLELHGIVSYPQGQLQGCLEGTVSEIFWVGTDMVPGATWIEHVPTGAQWEIISIHFQLLTSAAGINRLIWLTFYDPDFIVVTRVCAAESQPPNVNTWYSCYAAGGMQSTEGVFRTILIPERFKLPEGWYVSCDVANMEAGDDLSAPLFLVREHMTG